MRRAFRAELREKYADCDSMAVVQMEPDLDGGALERQAVRIITDELGVPCVPGYAPLSERNVLRRGASALLNARLQPVMSEFLSAIRSRAGRAGHGGAGDDRPQRRHPLMSRSFAAERPVETLLCGPAASVIGGQHLAAAEQG